MVRQRRDARVMLVVAMTGASLACATPKVATSERAVDAPPASAVVTPPSAAPSAAPSAPLADPEVLTSVAVGGGGGCSVRDDSVWWLRLDLRVPRDAHRRALVARAKSLPGTLHCGSKGETYLELTTTAARGLFGEHATFSSVSGAGNSADSCGSFASIEPASFVAPALAADVGRAGFDTDPKRALVTDLAPCVVAAPPPAPKP